MPAPQTQEDNKRVLGLRSWISCLLLLTLMLTLAIWAARWGWAEVLVAEPRNVMDTWKTGRTMPSDEELDRLNDLLVRASSLNSKNADIAFDQGRFAEWRAQKYPVWTETAYKHREEAINHFKRALDIRPSSGMLWVHLANSLVLNRQLYSGGMDALEKASVLAPLEVPVQQRVIWLGLSQWNVMDDEFRSRVRGIIENAMKFYQLGLVAKAVVDFRLEDEFTDLFVSGYQQHLLQRALAVRDKRN